MYCGFYLKLSETDYRISYHLWSTVGDPDRIPRIRMFLSHPDPDPDPLVRDIDPAPAPDLPFSHKCAERTEKMLDKIEF